MKSKTFILIFIFLGIIFVSGCTESQANILIEQIEQSQSNLKDYTTTVHVKDILGNEVETFDYTYKSPDKRRFAWSNPNKDIAINDGDVKYRYDSEHNRLFISGIISETEKEGIENLDYSKIVPYVLKNSDVVIEDSYLNDREVYKLTFRADLDSSKEIYYIDKQFFIPIKIETYLPEERCLEVKDFVEQHTDITIGSCLRTSWDFADLKINVGIEDNALDIKQQIPVDSEEIKSRYSECNPRRMSAKIIDEAGFEVKLPSFVPERFHISYAPEEGIIKVIEGGPDPCPSNAFLLDYTNVHMEPTTFLTYEEAEIHIDSKQVIGHNKLEQSKSPFTHFSLTFINEIIETKEVLINNVEGKFTKTKYGDFNLYWKVNDYYFLLRSGPGVQSSGEENYFSEEEMIRIAESII